MRGYHHQPEQSAEVLVGDGWFATGDVGEIDEDGRLRITDRKKDLVKTSNGKYIAPSAIESSFKAMCPIASQMVVQAEGRKLSPPRWSRSTPTRSQTWAHGQGLDATDPEALATGPTSCARTSQAAIKELNATAQPLGDHQGLPGAPARPHRRGRRAHPQPEGQAQGRQRALRLRDRGDVHQALNSRSCRHQHTKASLADPPKLRWA